MTQAAKASLLARPYVSPDRNRFHQEPPHARRCVCQEWNWCLARSSAAHRLAELLDGMLIGHSPGGSIGRCRRSSLGRRSYQMIRLRVRSPGRASSNPRGTFGAGLPLVHEDSRARTPDPWARPRATLQVAPELSDSVGPLEVREHGDVEQLGAGSRAERVQTFSESALELVGPHGRRLRRETVGTRKVRNARPATPPPIRNSSPSLPGGKGADSP
jgi:hypothetical protein